MTSKPRDRRLLIEEAAGLGKHRKRRRRAQLKLERTQDNLDRALDIEREARSRLRPLKRQAEAAELHARLERQSHEARWELARDVLRARRGELDAAVAPRRRRASCATRRRPSWPRSPRVASAAEQALARRGEQHEAMTQRCLPARGGERPRDGAPRAHARDGDVAGRARAAARARAGRCCASRSRPTPATRSAASGSPALEAELAQLDAQRDVERDRELAALREQLAAAEATARELEAGVERCTATLARGRRGMRGRPPRPARRRDDGRGRAPRGGPRRRRARRRQPVSCARTRARAADARSLTDELAVTAGCELALAAALGSRLAAAVVDDLRGGADAARRCRARRRPRARSPTRRRPPAASARRRSPARARCGDLVDGPAARPSRSRGGCCTTRGSSTTSTRCPPDFTGVAVTATGRAWFGRHARAAPGRRRRRRAGARPAQRARRADRRVRAARCRPSRPRSPRWPARRAPVDAADTTRDSADRALREAGREHGERDRGAAAPCVARSNSVRPRPTRARLPFDARSSTASWRPSAATPSAPRAERAERAARVQRLAAALARDRALIPAAERLADRAGDDP